MTKAEKMAEEAALEILKMTSQAEKQFWPVNIANILSWKGSGLISRVAERTRERFIEEALLVFDDDVDKETWDDIANDAKWDEEEVGIYE